MTVPRDPLPSLRERLRLIVITDRALVAPQAIKEVVAEVLAAGAPTIQLRDKSLGSGALLPLAEELRALCSSYGALFFVNDRLDVALAAGADGVHLGPDDLPVGRARAIAPDRFLIGYSTDDPDEARRAVGEGADYIGCGAVWTTGSKDDAGEPIGLEGLERVARSVPVPVVAIGGITVERSRRIHATGAAGCAVLSAVMGAGDHGRVVRAFLGGLSTAGPVGPTQ